MSLQEKTSLYTTIQKQQQLFQRLSTPHQTLSDFSYFSPSKKENVHGGRFMNHQSESASLPRRLSNFSKQDATSRKNATQESDEENFEKVYEPMPPPTDEEWEAFNQNERTQAQQREMEQYQHQICVLQKRLEMLTDQIAEEKETQRLLQRQRMQALQGERLKIQETKDLSHRMHQKNTKIQDLQQKLDESEQRESILTKRIRGVEKDYRIAEEQWREKLQRIEMENHNLKSLVQKQKSHIEIGEQAQDKLKLALQNMANQNQLLKEQSESQKQRIANLQERILSIQKEKVHLVHRKDIQMKEQQQRYDDIIAQQKEELQQVFSHSFG